MPKRVCEGCACTKLNGVVWCSFFTYNVVLLYTSKHDLKTGLQGGDSLHFVVLFQAIEYVKIYHMTGSLFHLIEEKPLCQKW